MQVKDLHYLVYQHDSKSINNLLNPKYYRCLALTIALTIALALTLALALPTSTTTATAILLCHGLPCFLSGWLSHHLFVCTMASCVSCCLVVVSPHCLHHGLPCLLSVQLSCHCTIASCASCPAGCHVTSLSASWRQRLRLRCCCLRLCPLSVS